MITAELDQNLIDFVKYGNPPLWEDDDGRKTPIIRTFKDKPYYLVDLTEDHKSADIVAEIYRANKCACRITKFAREVYCIWAALRGVNAVKKMKAAA